MRLEHKGNAKITTLTAELGDTAGDLVVNVADPAGWPDGSIGPFYGSVNKGTAGEEKILFASRSGSTLQVWTSGPDNGRGQDDTTIRRHDINSPIEHIWTAAEADAANAHQQQTSGAHGFPDTADLMTLSGDQVATGVKTFTTPVLNEPVATGGTHEDADLLSSDKVVVLGAQAEAEFRVRNTYIGSGVPDNAFGNDGDLYIDKG